jgi:hypothetical protein
MAKCGFPDYDAASFVPDPRGAGDRLDCALAASYLYYRSGRARPCPSRTPSPASVSAYLARRCAAFRDLEASPKPAPASPWRSDTPLSAVAFESVQAGC